MLVKTTTHNHGIILKGINIAGLPFVEDLARNFVLRLLMNSQAITTAICGAALWLIFFCVLGEETI